MLEQELKYRVESCKVLDAVLAFSPVKSLIIGDQTPIAERFQGVYYDTLDLALERQRCSLRARREGERFRAALKMPGSIRDGMTSREEYEIDLYEWPKTVTELPDESFRMRVAEIIPIDSKLLPRVEVNMLRRAVHLAIEESHVELVLDKGTIRGGTQSVSVCEVELELIQGDVQTVLTLGRQIERQFSLTRSTLSKHQIGLRLIGMSDETQ